MNESRICDTALVVMLLIIAVMTMVMAYHTGQLQAKLTYTLDQLEQCEARTK